MEKKFKNGLQVYYTARLKEIFKIFGADKNLDKFTTKKVLHVFEIWKDRKVVSLAKIKAYKEIFLKTRQQRLNKISQEAVSGDSNENEEEEENIKPLNTTLDIDGLNINDDSLLDENQKILVKQAKVISKKLDVDTTSPNKDKLKKMAARKKRKLLKQNAPHSPSYDKNKTKARSKESTKKIYKSSTIGDNTIYNDINWFDKVFEEVGNFNDNYIDQNIIKQNEKIKVDPKLFSDRMTSILRAPPSLDSDYRTKLTKLPPELADPSKLDKIVEDSLRTGALEGLNSRVVLNKNAGEIFTEIETFKILLDTYNGELKSELVQRRDLGCYLQLLAKERKISHKSFIDKTKSIMTREEKMKENEQKILLMCSDPKLPEVEDKLPDFGTLFKNENVD